MAKRSILSGWGMRVRFDALALDACRWPGRILKPSTAPAGYTPHTVVTEWLTLNCTGDWAGQRKTRWLDVCFARVEDAERARKHFEELGLWV